MAQALESWVEQARSGDRDALEKVLSDIKDDVYGIAVRMLWHPQDAEDATQEILLRIARGLRGFRGQCAFRTWIYRIASNHLLTTRKRRAEQEGMNFDMFAEGLGRGLSAPADLPVPGNVEQSLLVNEVKVGCMQGMLQCLDRQHRIVYVLGEILEMTGEEGAGVLEIEPATFRKRLSRARTRLREFMRQHCGLMTASNPCSCKKQVAPAIMAGRIDPRQLLFRPPSDHAVPSAGLEDQVEQMDELERVAALYRSHPKHTTSAGFVANMRRLLDSGEFSVLQ